MTDREWTPVLTAGDVTQEVLDIAVDITEGWYAETKIDWDDVWDRMEKSSLDDGTDIDMGSDDDSPAMKYIKSHIRALRKNG